MDVREKPKLLVVDDDEHIRYLVCAAAERSGKFSAIESAADGQAALDTIFHALRHSPGNVPELVLSDLCMPRKDGLELVRELKQHLETREIAIAIMTSSNRPNDRADAQAAGCFAFFDKPTRPDEFTQIVTSLPELSRRQAA